MKKRIYKTFVAQEFNAFVVEKSEKWYIPNKIVERRDRVANFKHYILAETEDEAIEKYKERYKWNDFDCIIDPWYGGLSCRYPCLNKKNPEFDYRVGAIEVHPSLDALKKDMRADEFLAYCKQEMMPLEVALSVGEDQ